MYPKSGSQLANVIQSGLSTQIVVKVGPNTVGAIQKITISQSREIMVSEEIGTDGIVDSHPKNATKISIDVTRIVFDKLRLTEALGRGWINIQSQRIPFNIEIIHTDEGSDVENAVIDILHNCWFKSFNTTYEQNNFIISEGAGLTCEKITTMINGKSAANGGKRGLFYEYDSVERTTDVTGKIGRLNSSGLN